MNIISAGARAQGVFLVKKYTKPVNIYLTRSIPLYSAVTSTDGHTLHCLNKSTSLFVVNQVLFKFGGQMVNVTIVLISTVVISGRSA